MMGSYPLRIAEPQKREDPGIVYAGKADQMIHGEIVSELKLETKPEA